MRKHLRYEQKSAVVLSEFSGCNEALGGVIKINPFNVDFIVRELNTAINMSGEDKAKRILVASEYIQQHSTLQWASSFLKDLKRANQADEKSQIMKIGMDNIKFIRTRKNFAELKTGQIEYDYQRTINRLIILDIEDTIPTENEQNDFVPTAEVVKALDSLS